MTDDDRIAFRLLAAIDIQGYSTRDTREQLRTQRELSQALVRAAAGIGLDCGLWDKQVGGDRELAILPPDVDLAPVVGELPTLLAAELRTLNHARGGRPRLRVRLALHHGTLTAGPFGPAGEAPIVVQRLVGAVQLRRLLDEQPDRDLAYAVSAPLFDDVVRTGFTQMAPGTFQEIRVTAKGTAHRGYVHTGDLVTAGRFDDLLEASSLGTPAARHVRSLTSADTVAAVRDRMWQADDREESGEPGSPAASASLEDDLYRDGEMTQRASGLQGKARAGSGGRNYPAYRSILAIAMEASTSPARTNLIKEKLRRQLHRLLQEAMAHVGLGAEHYDPFEERGDGLLAFIRPTDELPKTYLLTRLIPEMTRLLVDYNLNLPPAEWPRRGLRLRVVVHAGEIHHDADGHFGEALDVACQLLDARRLKQCLQTVATPLVLVVSEDIYWSIVKHEHDGIQQSTYKPDIRVQVAGRRRQGFLHVPAEAATHSTQTPST